VKVSVVIPAFNAAGSIERALQSVFSQSMTDWEVVVVDDASTDGTRALVEAHIARDNKVRLVAQPFNRGVSAARNAGIAAAAGEWIALLDADDAFMPTRLETLIRLGMSERVDMVADDILYYDWGAQAIVGNGLGRGATGANRISAADFVANSITGSSSLDFSLLKMVFRRTLFVQERLRYIEGLGQGEDFMAYAQALLSGATMVLTCDALYVYTESIGRKSRQSSSLSRTMANCDEMRHRTLSLLDHPTVRADPALAALVRKRARGIVWYASWERVYQPLRQRQAAGVLRAIATDWRSTLLLLRAAAQRLTKHQNRAS
jgi:succinoglycan biosynthesis protein ExoO